MGTGPQEDVCGGRRDVLRGISVHAIRIPPKELSECSHCSGFDWDGVPFSPGSGTALGLDSAWE